MELNDALIVWHCVPFCNERCSHGGFGELVELIMRKSGQDTTFADTAITDCDGLDLKDWLFTGHKRFDILLVYK